jgi:anti-sigma regulatory factor (Ser/Thr protein kinase)
VTAEPLCTDASDDHQHSVVLYRHDDELVSAAVDQFDDALRAGHAVLVIATEAHRSAFRDALASRQDVESVTREGRLIMLDAADALAGFMRDGRPDPERLLATVGKAIEDALSRAPGLTAFGEMVALLWQDGSRKAALELERLWETELQGRYPFSLLCAYPRQALATNDDPLDYVAVTGAHDSVTRGAPEAADAEIARHFPAHIGAPRLARTFVRETLALWGLSGLTDETALIASELATNAVRHAQSDFAVSLARCSTGVRVAVGDSAASFPVSQEADLGRSGGRGLHLIAQTASAWGHQPAANGKLVWAEIQAPVTAMEAAG